MNILLDGYNKAACIMVYGGDIELNRICNRYWIECGKPITRKATPDEIQRHSIIPAINPKRQ